MLRSARDACAVCSVVSRCAVVFVCVYFCSVVVCIFVQLLCVFLFSCCVYFQNGVLL